MKKKHFLFFCIVSFAIHTNCNNNQYNVRGARQQKSLNKLIIIGNIENRTFNYVKSLDRNLADGLKFELVGLGFQVKELNLERRLLNPDPKSFSEQSKDEIGDLPKSLRNAAGEMLQNNNIFLENLNSKEISELKTQYEFNFFIQGSISVYMDDNILEPKVYKIIFLDIFDDRGNRIGIVSSLFNDKNNLSALLLADVTKELSLKINEIIYGKVDAKI